MNDPPRGRDTTIEIESNNGHTLIADDFGFNDQDENSLKAIFIVSLPTLGLLTLDSKPVRAGDSISVNDLDQGLLVFSPDNGNGAGNQSSFEFQVQDDGGQANNGVDTDQQPKTITFEVASSIIDRNGDGFVDGSEDTAYQILHENSGITITASNGRTYNTNSTRGKIDMICAMQDGDNFAVITKLLSGKQKGKYRKWMTDSEGIIQKNIIRSEEQALSEGWELLFNVDLDQDDLIGSDQDQNGLADELVNTSYYLFNNGKPIPITTKQGAVQGHITSGNWDALVSSQAPIGENFMLLYEGQSNKLAGKYQLKTVNSDGVIIGSSGWRTSNQAIALGWDDYFEKDVFGENRK